MGISAEKSVTVKKTVEKKGNKTVKVILITLLAFVVVIAGGIFGAGLYAGGLNTVFPNVSASGVPLGGLTLSQAAEALVNAGYDKNTEQVYAVVTFPDDVSLVVTGTEAGLSLTSQQAARVAYDNGRTKNVFRQGLNYLLSFVTSRDVMRDNLGPLNEDHLRALVHERVEDFNTTAEKDSYTVTEKQILITKGSAGKKADEDAVYKLLVDALYDSAEKNAPVEADYSIGSEGGDSIDLGAILKEIEVAPVDARYDPETYEIVPHVDGVSFDVEAARKALESAETGQTVEIDLIITPPEVTTEALQKIYFADVLVEKTTHVGGTSNRRHNVRLSAEAVNNVVLNPGDTFSFNKIVGQRTAERGYKPAGAYVGGAVVDEVGGGICQVSSMLYHNALYADLEIVSRRNHMFTVSYLPLGIDATINWGTIDFKFKNNTDYPIRIVTHYDKEKNDLTMTFYGTKTNDKKIEIVYEVIKKTSPETIYKEDASVAEGKTVTKQSGSTGYTVDTYKLVYDAEGKLESRIYVDRSTYRAQNRIVHVPVGSLETGETESPAQETGSPTQETGAEASAPEDAEAVETPPGESAE
jgi:vancomycin resistance protein YoaR